MTVLRTVVALLLATTSVRAQTDEATVKHLISLPPAGPAILGLNELDLMVVVPGYDPAEFTVSTVEVAGNPGWIAAPTSDLGPLLFVPLPQVGDYLLAFLDHGVTVPLSWSASFNTFDGTDGTVIVSVVPTPQFDSGGIDTLQGPGGGGPPPVNICITEVARPNGEVGVRIEGTCAADCILSFKQFVTTKVTWSGAGGAGGVCPFPVTGSGNNGQPQQVNGGRVYVDSDAASGDYPANPHQTPAGQTAVRTRAMEDGPNVENLDELEALIEMDPNVPPGTDVESITVQFRFTTYVFVTCPPAGPQLVARVEWWYTRTYTRPPMHGPDAP